MEPKKLGSEWQRIVLDVCGLKRPEKNDKTLIHQTHLHQDHVALPGDIVDKKVIFKAPSALVDGLKRKYRKAMRINPEIQIEEYSDVLELPHSSFNPAERRHVPGKSYAHFFPGDILFVPECDDPAQVIREYEPRVSITMAARRSKRFRVVQTEFEADYWVDNRIWYWECWKRREQKVIPKVLYSCLKEDIELFRQLKHHGRKDVYTPYKRDVYTSL